VQESEVEEIEEEYSIDENLPINVDEIESLA